MPGIDPMSSTAVRKGHNAQREPRETGVKILHSADRRHWRPLGEQLRSQCYQGRASFRAFRLGPAFGRASCDCHARSMPPKRLLGTYLLTMTDEALPNSPWLAVIPSFAPST